MRWVEHPQPGCASAGKGYAASSIQHCRNRRRRRRFMRVPLEIAFKQVEASASLERLVRERVDRLPRYFQRIIACRVAVEAASRNNQHEVTGYRVRVEVSVPGNDLVATATPRQGASARAVVHDPYQAVRDAFVAMERRLKSYAGRLRTERKPRANAPHAVITHLDTEEGFGFLRTIGGREIYFHKNAVLNGGFARLELGDEVRFSEVDGEEGPQASTVEVIGRHGRHIMGIVPRA
ncbi:HPF/RaiA family ribosome-associated protein [Lujinxingia vulgaris]|uniref:HPF/RaiA family ribosome-associated protein n=2 Tax=Lujinxingia vulgaris TaxID=2600176 RepID=A0A5C6XLP7_9DELT|nr:HPF/RaiA family ribosome-associated protein [Lujinxingia vulgaris]